MNYNNVTWSCHSVEKNGYFVCPRLTDLKACFIRKHDRWRNFGHQLLASVIVNGESFVELRLCHYGHRCTIVIQAIQIDEGVPNLIQEHGWTWSHWIDDNLVLSELA